MKILTRDISLTLIIKLTLLFALWFVCFKGNHKPITDSHQWFFGSTTQSNNRGAL